jgi:intracellular sulfur oxidation DsrE/DsrF family protein
MKQTLLLLLTLFSTIQAQEYKAVFDCSSDDARYISGRMMLVEKTIEMIEKRGDKATVAITLHGGCVPMVSRLFDEVIYDEDMPYIQSAQNVITRLAAKKGVEIVACAMSLDANALEQKEVLPFVRISENSFIDTIGYQNRGYGLMTFK